MITSPARLLLFGLSATIGVFGAVARAAPASAFDGTWVCHWTNTTPKGLHNDVQHRLTIHTDGTSTRSSTNDLSVSTPKGQQTLRVIQSCYSTATVMRGDVLAIRWSALKLLSPAEKDMPRGLHWRVGPFETQYKLRGTKLEQIGQDPLTYVRAK